MDSPTPAVENAAARRPLKSRQTRWANVMSQRLVAANVSPNAISVFSVPCSFVGGAALLATRYTHSPALDAALFIVAILGIQSRLICNLLDGMVAIEGG